MSAAERFFAVAYGPTIEPPRPTGNFATLAEARAWADAQEATGRTVRVDIWDERVLVERRRPAGAPDA